ncbi:hypothetical protein [Microbacterium allomyrinae]|uniref:Uncharacterized protein n=1 Tax=Microbacterium allomyrinae TaxID=2830666 RepID=A0A9X1LUZ8_9MICO|nr:hypothetical protein [Microbacterium allomyrinae]MCC2032454.1 hypothetical protein [Microbacterium allomyrinae]
MSARSELKQLIEAQTPPATWEIYDWPTRLRTFDDAGKPVAIVIEQRTVAASRFSADENSIPLEVGLLLWVVVDAARGDELRDVEDDLEAALEQMIRILEAAGLPDHVWDGNAVRDEYDDQKPAYQITISATGALTPTEE